MTYSTASLVLIVGFESATTHFKESSPPLHSLGTPLSHFDREITSSNAGDKDSVVNVESIKRNLLQDCEELSRRRSSSSSSDTPLSPGGNTALANGEVKLRDKSWKEKRRSRERPLSAFLLDNGKITPTKDSPHEDFKPLVLDDWRPPAAKLEGEGDKSEPKGKSESPPSTEKKLNGVDSETKDPGPDQASFSGPQALAIFHRRRRTKGETEEAGSPTTPNTESVTEANGSGHPDTEPSKTMLSTPSESSSEQVTHEVRDVGTEPTPVDRTAKKPALENGTKEDSHESHTSTGKQSPLIAGRNKLLEKKMKMMALAMEGTLVDSQKIETGRVCTYVRMCFGGTFVIYISFECITLFRHVRTLFCFCIHCRMLRRKLLKAIPIPRMRHSLKGSRRTAMSPWNGLMRPLRFGHFLSL